MQVIVQGIKMDLDNRLSDKEKDFIDRMAKKGFLMTYYQQEDKGEGGSIGGFNVSFKNLIKLKK